MPRATYSLRMSFWIVPGQLPGATPCRLPTATYSASRMIAVALIVIDVDTWSSGMPSNSAAMSSIESMATPTRPTSPRAERMIGVVADLRRQIERDAQAHDALVEQVAVAAVRLGGRAETGVLPHRPRPAAIHRRLDAAGERETDPAVRYPMDPSAKRCRG